MTYLQNPPDNTCFGCGPGNPQGLQLQMSAITTEDGAPAVTCTFVPKANQTGWPGLMHTGLHFTVLYDLSYWAALTFAGKVMVGEADMRLKQERLPRVGRPCTATAVKVAGDASAMVIRAATKNERGNECAVLETRWKPASRAAIAKAGLELPQYLLEDMDP